jgi:hypothetical protein
MISLRLGVTIYDHKLYATDNNENVGRGCAIVVAVLGAPSLQAHQHVIPSVYVIDFLSFGSGIVCNDITNLYRPSATILNPKTR